MYHTDPFSVGAVQVRPVTINRIWVIKMFGDFLLDLLLDMSVIAVKGNIKSDGSTRVIVS